MLTDARFRATLFARVRNQDFLAINPRASRVLDDGQAPPNDSSPRHRRRRHDRRWTSFFIRYGAVADFETTGSPSTNPRLAFGTTEIKPSRVRDILAGFTILPTMRVCKSGTAAGYPKMRDVGYGNLESRTASIGERAKVIGNF